jgi:hypothetical protein
MTIEVLETTFDTDIAFIDFAVAVVIPAIADLRLW